MKRYFALRSRMANVKTVVSSVKIAEYRALVVLEMKRGHPENFHYYRMELLFKP